MNVGTGWDIDEDGEFEFISFLARYYRNTNFKLILFDVGANIGEYTSMLNDKFAGMAEIYSFEPSKKTFAKLASNIQIEKYNNISLFNIGFSDKKESLVLYIKENNTKTASIYEFDKKESDSKKITSEHIECWTIDDFCSVNNIDKIHFLKIDVEGHDLKVIEGSSNLLSNNRIDFIQFELGQINVQSRTYLKDFYDTLSERFSIYQILKDGLIKIHYDQTFEMFEVTNFVAIAKSLDIANRDKIFYVK